MSNRYDGYLSCKYAHLGCKRTFRSKRSRDAHSRLCKYKNEWMTENLHFRLPDNLMKHIENISREFMSMSEYIRYCIKTDVDARYGIVEQKLKMSGKDGPNKPGI